MVSSVTTTIFGVLLFIASSHADIFPGDDRYHDICVEIFNNVNNNAIDFKHLIISCSGCTPLLQTREIQTRAEMCDKLTTQHNNHAASFLNGITITSLECQAALSNPDMYKAAEWNKWSGRHCGSWKNVDATTGAVTQTFTDNALWFMATEYYNTTLMETFYRQDVDFETRGCCNDGWNESGGTYSVSWGWDPKDQTDHGGYQGSCVAYPFTKSTASCIVWITGEEAFLECVAPTLLGRRRTSAGFWGYGLWSLGPSHYQCIVAATTQKTPRGPPIG